MEQYSAPLTPEQQSHNKSSVTAMVLGIVSLVVTWFPIVGLVLAIVGLTMSRSNRKFAEAHGFQENSMNTAGYVTSVVGLILPFALGYGLGLILLTATSPTRAAARSTLLFSASPWPSPRSRSSPRPCSISA